MSFLDAPVWAQLLMLVGALAVASAVVSLFSTLGRRPKKVWVPAEIAVGDPAFLPSVAGILGCGVTAGGRVELLDNGVAYVPAILDAIRGARHSVHFMVYMWQDGVFSTRVLDALLERARAGVEVRVVLDAVGALKAPDERFEELKAAGGLVATFRPAVLGKLMRFHKRNHRRAIVIDGRVGFTGGAAVQDVWLGDAQGPDSWRDTMVRVTGPGVAGLQGAFAELWAYSCGEILAGEPYWAADPALAGGDEGDPSHGASVASAGPHLMHLVSSPSSEEHPLRLLFMLSFAGARERLWLTTPYFVPDLHLRGALADRARAGVDVRVLTASRHTDVPAIRVAAHGFYQELLDAGVRIWEYQPTLIHAKHLVVDGEWSVVGSANLDIRSKELNEENVVAIVDREFAATLERTFERDLERSEEITRERWARRGPLVKSLERLSGLFVEQY